MRLLSRAIRTASAGGATLPTVWRSLLEQQIAFRRGEVSMIAGPPGAGKSTLALSLAVHVQVPTLYISADTHSHTMSLRLLAMLTGRTQAEVEPMMEADREWAAQMLKPADHIMWEFDSAPTLKDVEDAILASRERLGKPRSALHGKIAQTPSLILTVHGQLASMGVCAVKNRYGPADANGATPVWLAYDPASMQIKDLVAP